MSLPGVGDVYITKTELTAVYSEITRRLTSVHFKLPSWEIEEELKELVEATFKQPQEQPAEGAQSEAITGSVLSTAELSEGSIFEASSSEGPKPEGVEVEGAEAVTSNTSDVEVLVDSLTVVSSGKEQWSSWVHSDETKRDAEELFAELQAVAFEVGLIPEDDVSRFLTTYISIRNRLLDDPLTLPGFGFSLRKPFAIWISAILVFSFLAVIRNRLRSVVLAPDFGAGESWLAVDHTVGLERLAAAIWIALVFICPWIVSSALILTVAAEAAANGAITSLFDELISVSSVGIATIANGWLALTTASVILHLRMLRTKALRA